LVFRRGIFGLTPGNWGLLSGPWLELFPGFLAGFQPKGLRGGETDIWKGFWGTGWDFWVQHKIFGGERTLLQVTNRVLKPPLKGFPLIWEPPQGGKRGLVTPYIFHFGGRHFYMV